ncbi:MAG: alpha/beta hydrolase [bacterium]|nr:alpha/beta hydrolase [bacterium]
MRKAEEGGNLDSTNTIANEVSCRKACYISGWGYSAGVFADWSLGEENCCFDLPELSRTSSLRSGSGSLFLSSWARLSPWAQGLAVVLENECPEVLVAWSMGAIVALELLLSEMEFLRNTGISRLVLLAPTLSFVARPGWDAGQNPSVLRAMLMSYRRKPQSTLRAFALSCSAGRTDTVLAGDYLLGDTVADALADQLDYLSAIDLRSGVFQAALESSPQLLLIHGDKDTIIPGKASSELGLLISQSQFVELEGESHLLPLSCRARQVAENWCKGQGILTSTVVFGGEVDCA